MISFSKHDPAQHQHRRYCLWVQPTLFGDYSLMSSWGRAELMGGQTARHDYDRADDAAMALNKAIMKRITRGYRYKPVSGLRPFIASAIGTHETAFSAAQTAPASPSPEATD